jgi:hypothetical protein
MQGHGCQDYRGGNRHLERRAKARLAAKGIPQQDLGQGTERELLFDGGLAAMRIFLTIAQREQQGPKADPV